MAASQNYDNALARLRELQRQATGSDQNAIPASKPAASTSNPPADRSTLSKAFLARHPDVKQALNAYANARVNFQYGAIFRSLGLTTDQVARMLGVAECWARHGDNRTQRSIALPGFWRRTATSRLEGSGAKYPWPK